MPLLYTVTIKNGGVDWTEAQSYPTYQQMVGICGLEPQTSSLSVTRSNQLSYIPVFKLFYKKTPPIARSKEIYYNELMYWEFSFGWFIAGILIMIAGVLVVRFHRQISDNLVNGFSSYEKVKLAGLIISGIGFIFMTCLHTTLIRLFLHLILPDLF